MFLKMLNIFSKQILTIHFWNNDLLTTMITWKHFLSKRYFANLLIVYENDKFSLLIVNWSSSVITYYRN